MLEDELDEIHELIHKANHSVWSKASWELLEQADKKLEAILARFQPPPEPEE